MDTAALQQCQLFRGITGQDLIQAVNCIASSYCSYQKNSLIFHEGAAADIFGVVLKGNLHVIQEDYWGNRTIVARLNPGDCFAESFVCAGAKSIPVSVLSTTRADLLFLDYKKILAPCANCEFHQQIIQNLLTILAEKNMKLTEKIDIMSQRNIQNKLMAFFSRQAYEAGGNQFEIPYSRQELADYLGIDRSAMGRVMSQLQQDGHITYHGNKFELPKKG